MHAGIDDQPDRAPHLVLQASIFTVWILIKADLFAEALRIKRPAFAEGIETRIFAELWHATHLLPDGELEVVSWNALVIRDGLYVQKQAMLRIVFIHVDATRLAVARRPDGIISRHGIGGAISLHRDDLQLVCGQLAEL